MSALTVPGASALPSQNADAIWMTNGTGEVREVTPVGNNVYVGGSFTAVRSSATGTDQPPAFLAAFNRVTGERKAGFQPQLDGDVRAIAASPDGSTLYVGGTFINVDGKKHKKLTGIDPVTGRRDPSFDVTLLGGGVLAIAVAPDGDVFVGGAFTSINGQPRAGLARLGPDGTVRPWNPAAIDTDVHALHIHPGQGRVYVGGQFPRMANAPRTNNLVAFSLSTGQLETSFQPQPSYQVNGLDVAGGKVFAAVAGPGGRAVAYDTGTGAELGVWLTDGDVKNVEIIEGIAHFVGHWFRTFGGQPSERIHGVTVANLSLDESFVPPIGGPLFDISPDGPYIWLGGSFTAPPVAAKGFARFSPAGYVPPPDTEKPTKPLKLKARQLTTSTARLLWQPSTDNVGVSHYDIFVDEDKVGSTEYIEYLVGGLQPGTEYTFRVRAVDYSGKVSKYSRTVTRSTAPDTQPPTAPQDLGLLKKTRSAIHIGWTASTDDFAVVEYRVFRDGSLVATTTTTSYWDRGLAPGRKYAYRVRAVDMAGNVSSASNKISPKTLPVFVNLSASWRYLDDASEAPSGWAQRGFSHAAWPSGRAELGYGDGDENTVINQGPVTAYFRKRFTVADAAAFSMVRLRLIRDDGAVVYLNGVELARSNMPDGPIEHGTRAASRVRGAAESEMVTYLVPADALRSGANTIAVEVHQAAPGGSDLSFALKVILVK